MMNKHEERIYREKRRLEKSKAMSRLLELANKCCACELVPKRKNPIAEDRKVCQTCPTRKEIDSIQKVWDKKRKEVQNSMAKYSVEVKNKAIALHIQGVPGKVVAKKLKIPYNTVWCWLDEYKKTQNKPVVVERETMKIDMPSLNERQANGVVLLEDDVLEAEAKQEVAPTVKNEKAAYWESQFEGANLRYKEACKEIDGLQARIEGLEQDEEHLVSKLEKAHGEIKSLKAQLHEVNEQPNDEVLSLQSKVANLEATIDLNNENHQARVSDLQRKLMDAKAVVFDRQSEIEQLKAMLKRYL